MGKVIKIAVATESRAFAQGIKTGVIKPLDDAQEALEDLAKEGRQSGDKLEDSLRDAGKRTDALKKEYQELGDAVRDAGRRGSDGMKTSMASSGEAVREFGDEAKQNMSEAFSSFRGEGEDIVQIVQDTFGGVIGGLGPIGMAAGIAGAAGIGMMMGGFEKAKEEEAAFREQVSELAETLIETGGVGAEAVEAIAEKLRELAAPTEEGVTSLSKLQEQAEKSESGFRKLAQAYAGNVEGLDEIIEAEKEALEAMDNRSSRRSKTTREEIGDRRDIVASLEEQRKVVQEAQEAEEAWAAAGGPLIEARAAAMETLQSELDSSVGAWSDYYDAETGATDPGQYIAAMEARISATSNFNDNVQRLAEETGLSFEETQMVLDQGADFGPMLESILNSGLGDEFAAQVQAAVGGGQEIIDGNPLGATVDVEADTAGAEGALETTATDRSTTVKADANTKAANAELDGVANKKRTAKITAKASTSSAESDLNNVARGRSASVSAVAYTGAASNALDRLVADRSVTIRARVVDQRGVEVP